MLSLFLVLPLGLGCDADTEAENTPTENPSVDCEADGDGGRFCYHAPDLTDSYLPDCSLPLERELWRVFQTAAGDAYVIPRPDGTGLLFDICDGGDADLASLFTTYDLCVEVVTDPAVVNSMDPADALRITHALHGHLRFQGVESFGQWNISPWAPDVDLIDACDLIQGSAAATHCSLLTESDELGECLDMAPQLSEDAVMELAAALNQLYGIEAE
jgi:hypothetical protein